jgi:hypothetical protein
LIHNLSVRTTIEERRGETLIELKSFFVSVPWCDDNPNSQYPYHLQLQKEKTAIAKMSHGFADNIQSFGL